MRVQECQGCAIHRKTSTGWYVQVLWLFAQDYVRRLRKLCGRQPEDIRAEVLRRSRARRANAAAAAAEQAARAVASAGTFPTLRFAF